jgi:hypothetical protein
MLLIYNYNNNMKIVRHLIDKCMLLLKKLSDF